LTAAFEVAARSNNSTRRRAVVAAAPAAAAVPGTAAKRTGRVPAGTVLGRSAPPSLRPAPTRAGGMSTTATPAAGQTGAALVFATGRIGAPAGGDTAATGFTGTAGTRCGAGGV
jgi:hypothetical protein